ncbi:C6 transcription factor [Limtongia smithiae]|uniref:C6 transcription factor n=1 Tax=Limtongia smithiae TaxID=1125753 RepID=UPI0034CFDB7D
MSSTGSAQTAIFGSRPLPKRCRAPLACNACRHTKSKCDSNRPVCDRCSKQNIECLYVQNARDKRLERQEERRARWALKSRVTELEAQLAAIARSGGHVPLAPKESNGIKDGLKASQVFSDDESADAESTVDMLAAGVFDNRPATDIGYFGPTSNHALFRSLTTAVAKTSSRNTAVQQGKDNQPPSTDAHFLTSTRSRMLVPQIPVNIQTVQAICEPVPGSITSIQWITRFSDTVGAVLPYANESVLAREVVSTVSTTDDDKAPSRSSDALLNIVYAHALCTMDSSSAERYYHRSLGLMFTEEQTLRNPNLEAIQVLLLLGSFQQNSQRAMASLVTHSLAVKTAYQLGLQCPSMYEGLDIADRQLRAKLWFGVVIQDRLLSTALGRPCLIPPQHVRMQILNSLVVLRTSTTDNTSAVMDQLSYFRHLSSLQEIIGTAVESIYDCNIGLPSELGLGSLTVKTIELLSQLAQWREKIGPRGILSTQVDLDSWDVAEFQSKCYMLLLSVYYYRTIMLVSGPVLMAVLDRRVTEQDSDDSYATGFLRDATGSVLRSDLQAVKEFGRILECLLRRDSAFFKRNAAWWVCNFTAFTMCLHRFAFWLMTISTTTLLPDIGLTSIEAESVLHEALDSLRAIGGTSIMSLGAYHGLNRYIRHCKSTNTSIRASHGTSDSIYADMFQDLQQIAYMSGDSSALDNFHELSTASIDDLFGQLGDNDFLGAGAFFLDQ